MELAPRRPEQRLVHGVANQRMGEAAVVTFDGDQAGLFERASAVIRVCQHVTQRVLRKADAERRCRMYRMLRGGRQPLDAREHQPAHTAGQRGLARMRGTQQLLEVQRVTVGGGDAALDRSGGQACLRRREITGFVLGERAEVPAW